MMKTEAEMEAKLTELEADPRIEYPVATLFENALLALIQVDLEAQCRTLRWALGLPYRKYHGKD
jgi:hypothetical protein